MNPQEMKKLVSELHSTGLREVRYHPMDVQKRESAEDDGYVHIDGKPIDIGTETVLYEFGGIQYKEIIEVGAFNDADMTDVVLNVNHGEGNYAVARTRNGTLSFDIKDDGVYINAKLNKNNQRCMQFYQDVSEKLLDRMSFAFTIAEEDFDEKENTFHVRKVAKVFDVSAVEFPAYENTSISATRSEKLESFAEELESRREADKAKKLRSEILEMLEEDEKNEL